MRPYIWMVLAVTFSAGRTTAQQFTLDGHVRGQDTGMVTLSFTNAQGGWVTDTQHIDKGRFVFTAPINGPTPAYLKGRVQSRAVDDPHFLEIFLQPGPMSIDMDAADYHGRVLKGSPAQDDLDTLARETRPITDRLQVLSEAKQYGGEADSLKSVLQAASIAYAQAHPTSYASPELIVIPIANKYISLDSSEALFHHLAPAVQASDYGKIVAGILNKEEAANIGQQAHDFTLTDADGKQVSLSSFLGKSVVLLDFWASWCVPCREFTPRLKALYDKYKDRGLTVLTVSVDEDAQAWKKAVRQDSIGRLCNLHAGAQANVVKGWYAVQGIPADVLVNKDGTIAGRYLAAGQGGEDDLDKKLAELLQ